MDSTNFDNERHWYVLQTYNGLEYAAKRNLESRIESMNMSDKIFNVLIPEQTVVVKQKDGTPKEVKEQIYPGYVFVEMIVTNDTWFMVRNTPMVTGFLGSYGGGAKPIPLMDEEMIPILKQCLANVKQEEEHKFVVGQEVAIISGAFAGQNGKIDSIDYEKHSVNVLVDFFGRSVAAELDFIEIKEIN